MANKGTIDAKVTGVAGVSLDNTYVSYSVKYLDNNIDITAANGRLLAANQRKMVLIEVKFKESVTTEQFKAIPQAGITVDLNEIQIQYSQNDGSADATDPEQKIEKRYNISVNDISNIDLDSHFFQGNYAFGFVDQNGIQHVFTIVHADESEQYYFLAYLPDFINYPDTSYFYDDEANNWFETVDDVVTGNTLETESLVFSNVILSSDEEYEQAGYSKFTSQMISDILNITEVE